MVEKFNLDQMREEIVEDEKLAQRQTKSVVSQEQIAAMMKAGKARRRQNVSKNR